MNHLCCCGHSRYAHVDAMLSVPLVNPAPTYEVRHPAGIYSYPTATYDYQPCWCGCCSFEAYEP